MRARFVNDRIEHGSLGMTSVVFEKPRLPAWRPRGVAHRIRLPRWARERGAALNDFPALERGRTALVNIDMQTAFLAEDEPYGNRPCPRHRRQRQRAESRPCAPPARR